MNTKKYTWLFYFITLTIVATIGVQFYWNYKNYEENKQRVTNDIQLSFDTAIEEYYASLAKSNYVTIINSDNASFNSKTNNKIDSIRLKKPSFTINSIKFSSTEELSQEEIDSLMISTKDLIESTNRKIDSTTSFTQFFDKKKGIHFDKDGTTKEVQYFKGKKAADSLKLLKNLQPIFISFLDNKIEYDKLDSLIDNQLNKKGIEIKNNLFI